MGALSCVRSEGALGGRGDVVEEEEVVEAHMHVVGEGLGLSLWHGHFVGSCIRVYCSRFILRSEYVQKTAK